MEEPKASEDQVVRIFISALLALLLLTLPVDDG